MSNDKVEATFHGQRRFDVLGAVEAIGREEENEKLRTEVDRLTATLDRVRERAQGVIDVRGAGAYRVGRTDLARDILAIVGPAPADPDE